MIKSLRLLEEFNSIYADKKAVSYTLDTNTNIRGPLRSMQKFVVILMTDIGTDPIRPWFGTNLSKLNQCNITNRKELELFIKSECTSAITQFFKLQEAESTQNAQTGHDVIEGLELININIDTNNNISVIFRFTPLKSNAITFAVNL